MPTNQVTRIRDPRCAASTHNLDAAYSGSRHYVCERALKRAILHRKNSMFYKTCKGAEVGDIYMSLIHTCQLCGVNPFEYLQALQIHAQEVLTRACLWLPWNYRAQLVRAA